VNIDDSSPEIVEALLDFISKGLIPSDIDDDDKAIDLIKMADMFGLDLLTKACETSMMKNLSPDNALEALIIVNELNHISKAEHREQIVAYIKQEAARVVVTENWETFLRDYPSLVTEIFLSACSS